MDFEKLRAACMGEREYTWQWRRYFHCHPELSGREFETVRAISGELTALGIEHTVIPDGGVLGWLDTGREGKHVLLRADCDALPIQEAAENGALPRQYISANPGSAHMCGHDAHTAMLLTAAKVLKAADLSALSGRIYFLFERGEEGGMNYYYIMRHIQEQHIRIDSCFALHVEPKLPTGTIWLEEGPGHAGNVNFEITLRGKGGHGSRPDLANHPLDCFVAIMNDLNTVRMKQAAPQDILTVNVGSVHCGAKRNIVPETLEFKGTARFYRAETGRKFKESLRKIIDLNAEIFGCTPEYTVFSGPSLAQLNHREASALARQAVSAIAPELVQIKEKEPEMSSESYGVLCAYYPSTMGLLGTGNGEKGTCEGLHSPRFDVDLDALPYGAAALTAYAVTYLSRSPDFPFMPFPGSIDDMMAVTDRIPPRRLDGERK